jgi:hypothetical protein
MGLKAWLFGPPQPPPPSWRQLFVGEENYYRDLLRDTSPANLDTKLSMEPFGASDQFGNVLTPLFGGADDALVADLTERAESLYQAMMANRAAWEQEHAEKHWSFMFETQLNSAVLLAFLGRDSEERFAVAADTSYAWVLGISDWLSDGNILQQHEGLLAAIAQRLARRPEAFRDVLDRVRVSHPAVLRLRNALLELDELGKPPEDRVQALRDIVDRCSERPAVAEEMKPLGGDQSQAILAVLILHETEPGLSGAELMKRVTALATHRGRTMDGG